jgi:transcription-repair coupling factor (superfamily II helicase)
VLSLLVNKKLHWHNRELCGDIMFNHLREKLNHCLSSNATTIHIQGLNVNEWLFLISQIDKDLESATVNKNLVFITQGESEAEELVLALKELFIGDQLFYFPGLDIQLFSGMISSEASLIERLSKLFSLQMKPGKKILVCSYESFLLKNPTPSFLQEHSLRLNVSDVIAPNDLASKLHHLGYRNSITVEEPGTFSQKGEIFDLFPLSGSPVRIHYFDELIEEMFEIDLTTNRTIKERPLTFINAGPCPGIIASPDFARQLREALPKAKPGQKARFDYRENIFRQLNDNQLFENYPLFFPLFFREHAKLTDYLSGSTILCHLHAEGIQREMIEFFDKSAQNYEGYLEDTTLENIYPLIEQVYFSRDDLYPSNNPLIKVDPLNYQVDLDSDFSQRIEIRLLDFPQYIKEHSGETILDREGQLRLLFSKLIKNKVVFCYSTESVKNEFLHLLDVFEVDQSSRQNILYVSSSIDKGFYYPVEKVLVLSGLELFKRKLKRKTQKEKANVDLFAEQIASLKIGDYVIHTHHGLGKFMGIETIEQNGIKTDFLVLLYESNDKVYVPVYKINLIQKHANAHVDLKVNNLRTNKFQQVKTRARESVKKLAFDLIRLQAERETAKAYSFSPPDEIFRDFEEAFSYKETPDQLSAINDVLHAMQSSKPMDYLVCGDVGFGKTEVAMRAAFKAVLDHKQVAVLVPTTVLALQHFHSFKNRFKNFAVNVEYLSRFRSPKEEKDILLKLAAGTVDIVIGTHKLLSDKIKFHDLGLVVVDEEHRFGVGHKEQMKLMKASIDFLTLTATPIPRTLQMAYLGLRDLSLIRTAPPKRQSIKTYIMKEDKQVLREAIVKELARGGQVFIVHNKVQDIEQFSFKIRELVPDAKIIHAHGQLPENELEKRMADFYSGKYQILISTTIIESGIDIPNANTMIIDRADTFGLAQLHQLRGRIGRSDRKAYAYFMIPNTGKINNEAEKRLKALQDYANKGSGFSIASCDLEIRGAGDLLGGEQSGHLESIGLELYTELLKEAIAELKGEKSLNNKDIEIICPHPAYIPHHYVTHSSERLRQYKILANSETPLELEQNMAALEDSYGPSPVEVQNLQFVILARIHLKRCAMKQVQVAQKLLTLRFDKALLEQNTELRDRIIETYLNKGQRYRFSPDFSLSYSSESPITPELLVKLCMEIAQKIDPC